MATELISTKVSPKTLYLLKIMAAMAGKRQYAMLEEIVIAAARKQKIKT